MKLKRLSSRLSLTSRLHLSVTLLLVVLVAAMLFIIQKRGVRLITNEAETRGVLIARQIADLNMEALLFWELETLKKNIESQVDEELIYVQLYDRFNAPLVGTDFLRDYEAIACCSRLPEIVTRDTVHFEKKALRETGRLLHILEVEVPVFAQESPSRWGSIKIGLSLEHMRVEIRNTRLLLIFVGLAGLVLGVFGSAVLARQIIQPLKKLDAGTVKVSQGDFSNRIPVESRDEIGHLAKAFNEMSAQLLQAREKMEEANRRLVQAEKLASIGRMAATIAHEIRNPLTSVKLNIQRIYLSAALDETEKEHLRISQTGIGQIERFIKELLSFTRAAELNLNRFAVEQILDESLKLVQHAFQEKKIVLERRYAVGLPEITADGDRLRQVFTNILQNAYDAVEEHGRVEIDVSAATRDGQGFVLVRIADSGPGIPAKDRDNIFEPFFTTKASGIGLGLSNARKILEQHGGTVRVVDLQGRGACFEVVLPVKGGA